MNLINSVLCKCHVVVMIFALCLLSSIGAAQSLGSLLPSGSSSTESNVDEIMRSAAENGINVVVIDSTGRILNQRTPPTQVEQEPGSEMSLMGIQDDAVAFREALFDKLANLPDAFNEVIYILRATSPDGTLIAYLKVFLITMGLFAVGIVVEVQIFGRRIAKSFVVSRIRENPKGYAEKMPFLVFRFFMGIIGTLVSMVVANVLGLVVFGPLDDPAMQFTVSLIYVGYFSVRVMAGIWRMILSPYLRQYRIPVFEDRDAKRLHYWLTGVATAGLTAGLLSIWIAELGLNDEIYAFLASMLTFGVALVNFSMVFANGKPITRAILNGRPFREVTRIQRFLSIAWRPLVLIYIVVAWITLTYDLVLGRDIGVPLLAGAYVILTTIIVVYGIINYFIERGFERARLIREQNDLAANITSPSASDLPETVQGPRINTYEDLAKRIAGVLALVAGIYACVTIWTVDTGDMLESWSDRFLDVIVICFLGYIAYYAFRIWIDGKIREEQGELEEAELGDEGGGSSASRLATLLPLFRNFVLILIVVTLFLIVLMELGVNVGPLFAGAGIVGVAVGFGSQSLVRDVFSGAFFLFDDAFRKGEYIDVGGVKGTVEKISVRSFQLRHHLGALHTMPFGEIQVLTNYSRDWVIMKLPLRVTYDTDVEKVRKLIKNLGIELLDDPVIGHNFIQPLKSQGVIEMQDSAMIIRVKFMTKPGDQWLVRKKVYEDIRALFEREGIKFAHREVTVRLADGKVNEMSEEEKEAIAAAAHASLEEELLEDAGETGDDR